MKKILVLTFILISHLGFSQRPKTNPLDSKFNIIKKYEDSLKASENAIKIKAKPYERNQNEPSLGLVAKVNADKITLRWTPLNYDVWQRGNRNGYDIYRKTIARNGKKVQEDSIKVNKYTLSLLPPSYWTKFGKENKYAEVSARLIALRDSSVESQDFALGLTMLMSNMSPNISSAMGLLFDDKNISKEDEYEYIVKLKNSNYSVKKTVLANKLTNLIAPTNLFAEYSDSTVFIRWQVSDSLLHSAYELERSDDGSVNFFPVNTAPILINQDPDSLGRTFVSKTDKLPKLFYNYYYRVRAITPFGELSKPSGIVQVFGHLEKLPRPIVKQNIINNKTVQLTWDFPDTLNKYISGFKVFRSDKLDGVYQSVNIKGYDRKTRMYVDSFPQFQNYYKIAVLDWVGKETNSVEEFVQLEDITPPAKPKILENRVNKLGVVRLAWKANKEKDLFGYRVFMGYDKKLEFSLMSPSLKKDTVYMDTLSLQLLNKNIYYTVVAYDRRLNASLQSDTVLIKRPDIIPPAAPNFTNYIITDSTIRLNWENSPSEDVIRTVLYRRATNDSVTTILGKFFAVNDVKTFLDTTALPKKNYEYQLVAFDEGGLTNKEVCKINLSLFDNGFKPKIKDVQLSSDSLQKTITFKWKYEHPDLEQFIIYRKKGSDGYLSVFKYLPKNFKSYVEKDVPYDSPYSYAIMATFKDGSETKLTKPVEMIIPEPKKK
jgi:uncharacterized protein